jgi:hypothetical protein
MARMSMTALAISTKISPARSRKQIKTGQVVCKFEGNVLKKFK